MNGDIATRRRADARTRRNGVHASRFAASARLHVSAWSGWILATMWLSIIPLSLAHGFGSNDKAGTSAAAFLKIGPGARPVGMGEAYTGVADDIHAIYWNPAGLGRLERPELTGMHMQWFQDIQYEFAAFAFPTRSLGTWGFAVSNLHTDNIDRRLEDTDEAIGQFGSSDKAYWLSYGHRLSSRLAVGGNLKYVHQTLDSVTGTAWAVDGGLLYETGWRHLRLGASAQNLGTKVKFNNEGDPLPMTFRFGASAPVWRKKLLLSSDLILPRDHEVGLAVGGEYKHWYTRTMAYSVRSGYRTDSDVDGLKGVSAGGGLTFGRVSVDFAWVPFGELGNSYRYALHVKFGPPSKDDDPTPNDKTLQKAAAPSAIPEFPFDF
jgi:hypothetical protein